MEEISTTSNSLLLQVLVMKNKNKFNLREFMQIVSLRPQFENINERGIYIQCLAELLLKALLNLGLRIKSFNGELQQREARKRTKNGGNYEGRRGQKSKKDRHRVPLNDNRNIEDLTEESLSNPSNVQRPREDDGRKQENSNPGSSHGKDENSQESKDSKDSKLKLQLNKITEQIRGHEETFVSDPLDGSQPFGYEDSQNSSNCEIKDFDKKMKIFSIEKDRDPLPKSTTRRKKLGDKNLDLGTQTKKKSNFIFDQSTMLEETIVSDAEVTINESMRMVSIFDDEENMEEIQNFLSDLKEDKKDKKPLFDDAQVKSIKQFMNFIIQKRPQVFESHHNNEEDVIENQQMQFPDYTMPHLQSVPLISQSFMNQSLDLSENEEYKLDQIASLKNQQKSAIFYQLLWRAQKKQILLIQNNPEEFSQIIVRQVKEE